VLDAARAIHTLVFGLVLVGIVGLGPLAGILAIALHSMGTYGKLQAEAIESAGHGRGGCRARHRRRAAAGLLQRRVAGGAAAVRLGSHLYVWEFNIRDSTVLGLIGAGGLGLLISEAVSLFQWVRLATLLIVVVLLVSAFDALSRRIRAALL
jgi:phosphonate transport system permease protein